MFSEFASTVHSLLRAAAGIFYHSVIVALSAVIAFLLPASAKQFLGFWSRMEHDKLSLIAVEMAVAVFADCRLQLRPSQPARPNPRRRGCGRRPRLLLPPAYEDRAAADQALKEEQGSGRTIMVIGSSGYSTFVDQVGDLSSVLDKCLGANILLVNPYSQDASARIEAMNHPEHSLAAFREEIRQSIALLKRLKAMGKSVRLKLYADQPLVKMVILGDYLWLQHYHADLDVQTLPEYVLRHNRQDHGLYTHYFQQRWESGDIPEYDLDTDELVYRNRAGKEFLRKRFEGEACEETIVYAEVA